MAFRPPKPATRPRFATPLRRLLRFRKDIFASQPEHLYRAWMAEQKTPFYNSYFINDPELLDDILKARPMAFPKSEIIAKTLRDLLGASVFVTNGALWEKQRRIIDPAFAGGRLKPTFPAMLAAVEAALARLEPGEVEIEFEASHLAADIIFRTLFSIPITHETASEVFENFRTYQRAQPVLNLAELMRLPSWVPRFRRKAVVSSAATIRSLLSDLVAERARQIESGTAPDDLATKIMTFADPDTGEGFTPEDMVDQVAIFFLAGHETSASALGWALYLLAESPEVQARVAAEVDATLGSSPPEFADLTRLTFTRDVFRETLRLYPPVPMMVRETKQTERFRGRAIKPGSLAILSPFHLQRHQRLWDAPDLFDPDRWSRRESRENIRNHYMPFSAGSRICPGAGFAMIEGILALAMIIRRFEITATARKPQPVAHLTLRAKDGIWLKLTPRG
ncbi:cytochrome P450 [Paracoccaceae bacterium GXU_MW_L88]